MALVLEVHLVGDHREHPFQAIILELMHRPAAQADQVLVLLGRGHGLVPPEPLAEVMGAKEAALHERVEGAVDRGRADARAKLLQAALDGLDREMFVGFEQDAGDQVRCGVTGRR